MHASKVEGARRSSNGLEEQIYFMNVCYYIVSTSDCDIEILIIKDIFLVPLFLMCAIHIYIVTGRLRSSNIGVDLHEQDKASRFCSQI